MDDGVRRFHAVCAPGLEAVTLAEVAALGGEDARMTRGGVGFAGPLVLGFRANLLLRTAVEVRMRLARFHTPSERLLARGAAEVDWRSILVPTAPEPALEITTTRSALHHRTRIAEIVRGAWPIGSIVAPRDLGETAAAAQRVFVRIVQDTCTISADMSGELLHRRGYRLETSRAPLRETIAAALLLAMEWDPTTPFVDPMCGSGTFPIEAALLARNVAPGIGRRFACEAWPIADAATWSSLRAEARAAEGPAPPAAIVASDRNAGALGVAQRNAERADVAHAIEFARRTVADLEPPPGAPGLLLTNLPYGKRIRETEDLRGVYAELGRVLGERFRGWRVGCVTSGGNLASAIGIPPRRALEFRHGGLVCQLIELDTGA